MTISTFGQRFLWLAYEKIPLSSFYIGSHKNCKHKKYNKKNGPYQYKTWQKITTKKKN